MIDYKIISERMRILKKQKGIFFAEIERVTGFRGDVVRRLLGGMREPKLTEFAMLCIALEASADELLFGGEPLK